MSYRAQAPSTHNRVDTGVFHRLPVLYSYIDANGSVRFYSTPQSGLTRVYWGTDAAGRSRTYSAPPAQPREPFLGPQGRILF